ncbi:MAG: hypothetical protein GY846_27105 [Deltaproteobacteria bacterium]|nr:hypothetical protein [Deltaproteobacteria bacterium]
MKIQPDIKAIMSWGFSETERVRQAFNLEVDGCIRKPHTLGELTRAVNVQLDGAVLLESLKRTMLP